MTLLRCSGPVEIDASTQRHSSRLAIISDRTQDTWFVHRSDSPVLTFKKLEISLNEHGVAPTTLQQPNVGLFPIRAGGPSRLLRLRQF